MTTVNMLDAKSNLSKLVDRIERGLEGEIVIARNGRPAARLVPIAAPRGDKRIGLLKGKFKAPSLEELNAENAAIALPAYQDYTVRARVAEGMGLASAAKVSVLENAANGSAFASGYTAPTATNNISDVAINADGSILVTTTARAGGGTVIFVPTPALVVGVPPASNVTWNCTTGTLVAKYRPAECRA